MVFSVYLFFINSFGRCSASRDSLSKGTEDGGSKRHRPINGFCITK